MSNPFECIMAELQSIRNQILNNSSSSNLNEPIYLKIDKAAEFLSMTKNALNQMVHKKQIPHLRKQGKLYFLRSELIEWIESGREQDERAYPEDILLSRESKKIQKHIIN